MKRPDRASIRLFTGTIRPLPDSGRPTGIYKQPVGAALALGFEGFAGDQQADRRVHGGPEKAVHLYPARHYAQLAERFPEARDKLRPGSLGENLSTFELTEDEVGVGDIWRLGGTRLQVCQPRSPCWKIDERFAADGMAAYIAEQRLTGWYWRVLTPGTVAPGDTLRLEESGGFGLGEALRLWQQHRPPLAELERLAACPGIAGPWRQKILTRLGWLRQNPDQALPAKPLFHVKPD